MKKALSIALLSVVIFANAQSVQSPSKAISLDFKLDAGKPTYTVTYKNKPIILQSALGVKLKNETDLASDFAIEGSKATTFNETWKPVLGEQSSIKNNYNELTVSLKQLGSGRQLNIIFRAFDEGVAFRYDFPQQKNLNYFIISDEVSQFNLTGNHKVFWIPGDFDSNEYEYNETTFSNIDTKKINLDNGIGVKSISGQYTVQSPLMMKTATNTYLNIFEAAVVNYPLMHLEADVTNYKLQSKLVPNAIGDKAYLHEIGRAHV